MKRALITSVLLMSIMLPVIVYGQQSVTVEAVEGTYYDCQWGTDAIIPGAQVTFYIRVTNLSGTGCAYDLTHTFQIYSSDGAQWSSLAIDSLPGTSAMFGQVDFYQGGLTGPIADTIGIRLLSQGESGSYDGYDDYLFKITMNVDGLNSFLCLDTVSASPVFDWSWTGLDGCPDIFPEWGGPYCYPVALPDPTTLQFDYIPADMTIDYCTGASYDYECYDPNPGAGPGPDDVFFEIVQGPGEINEVSGEWTWDGVGIAPGSATELVVRAYQVDDCALSVDDTVTLVINEGSNDAPYFSSGCRSTALAARNATTTLLTLEGYDSCPNDSVRAVLLQTNAVGPVEINGTAISFTPDPADTGTITVRVTASDGLAQADEWCEVYFRILECDDCFCCGFYTGGYTGNVDFDPDGNRNLADITTLISHVYIGQGFLLCPFNGNVDGDPDGKINLADITRLIDHVYISKTQTAICQ